MNKPFKHHFVEKESDITIISESKDAILRARKTFFSHRKELEEYVSGHESFLKSFTPVRVNTDVRVVNMMALAAELSEVGPMAAVAGALADLMLEAMKEGTSQEEIDDSPARIALVENGGEIAIDSEEPMKIALYAGHNELNLRIGFLIEKKDCPLGLGTSSASIGHAVSLGEADAATIFARDAALADAAATRICNLVKGEDVEKSIKRALDAVDDIEGVRGALISRENKVGQAGSLPKMFKIKGKKAKLLERKVKDLDPDHFDKIY